MIDIQKLLISKNLLLFWLHQHICVKLSTTKEMDNLIDY